MGKKKSKITQTETPRQDAFDAAWAKYRPLVPEDELAAVESSFSHPLCQAFRLNPLKCVPDMAERLTQRYGWQLESIPFCAEGLRVRQANVLPSQTAEHRTGMFYIQDSASMLPVTLYDAERFAGDPLILDMAASPGGKTSHLVARSMDRGMILANDSSLSRISALKTVLKNWGSIRHAVTNFPGESFGEWFPNTFDLILLDAPCSMQSLVSIDSHPMRPITEREEKALAQRQTALLESALHALKPGGQIVYSTCTLSPDEDEAVVDHVLKTFSGKIRVLDAGKRLPYPAPGLTRTNDAEFDPQVAGTVRLWPHRYETAGFFAALLQKDASFGSEQQPAPVRPWSRSSFTEMPGKEIQAYRAQLTDWFGLSLDDLLAECGCSLWKRGEEIWMIPERFLSGFSMIPCRSVGMRAAFQTSGGLIPDNDWVSRFFSRIDGVKFIPDEIQREAWRHGEDIHLNQAAYAKGTIITLVDDHGIFLGCGRVSADRIRNFDK